MKIEGLKALGKSQVICSDCCLRHKSLLATNIGDLCLDCANKRIQNYINAINALHSKQPGIHPKHKVGAEVFVIHCNVMVKATVVQVKISLTVVGGPARITVYLNHGDKVLVYSEDSVFATKDELIAHMCSSSK